ncbi:hypothetical protein TNCV_3779841 [Trichonephila clavipes]|nr:hypothetical protein TNCV_3779841 [Trichonephila clavipes]
MSSSPVPLKTRRVGQRCMLNLSRAETSSRWCGVILLELLETNLVILNHDQVTRTTLELATPSSNYDTTPTGGRLSSRQFQRAPLPYTAGIKILELSFRKFNIDRMLIGMTAKFWVQTGV